MFRHGRHVGLQKICTSLICIHGQFFADLVTAWLAKQTDSQSAIHTTTEKQHKSAFGLQWWQCVLQEDVFLCLVNNILALWTLQARLDWHCQNQAQSQTFTTICWVLYNYLVWFEVIAHWKPYSYHKAPSLKTSFNSYINHLQISLNNV